MRKRLLLIVLLTYSAFSINLQAQCISGDCDNGEGTYIYKDNSSYAGAFKNGMADGYGICQYSNGNRYAGHWQAHKFYGEGTFFKADGEVVKGIWKDGKLVRQLEYEPEAPKIWAVIVGVAAYRHARRLQYTDDDAYKMYAFLKSPAGGAIDDKRIKVLIDESATKRNIIANMRTILLKADYNDVVMFYFSGHGKDDSFLPFDYNGDMDTKLTFDEINTIFSLSKARHKICIADACHSGGLLASKGTGFGFGFERDQVFSVAATQSQIAVMVSSQADEESVESTNLRQGTFSHFLIRGLKGDADRNRDNTVTISELFNYVNRQVKSYTQDAQNPSLFGRYDPNMPIAKVVGDGQIAQYNE